MISISSTVRHAGYIYTPHVYPALPCSAMAAMCETTAAAVRTAPTGPVAPAHVVVPYILHTLWYTDS
jgi:hypothetical protein